MSEIETPSRTALIRKLSTINSIERVAIVIEVACALLFLLGYAHWSLFASQMMNTITVIGCACLAEIIGIAKLLMQNALPLNKLRTDKKIGHYHRDDLQSLVRRCCSAYGLSEHSITVCLTRDKSLNAAAFSMFGLGKRVWLGRVFLHRSLLHILKPEELYSVLLHEFAHIAKYYSLWMWATPAHLLFRISLALLLLQVFAEPTTFLFLTLFGVFYAFEWFSSYLRDSLTQPLEYLCDDAACEHGGVLPNVVTSLKLGLYEEAHQAVFAKTLELHLEGKALTLDRAMAIYESTLPFGAIDAAETQRDLERAYKESDSNAATTITARGFLEFIGLVGSQEDREAMAAEYQKLKLIDSMQTLPWARERLDSLSTADIHTLVSQIEAAPALPLFRTTSEIDNPDSSHPTHKKRILYAVRNYAK